MPNFINLRNKSLFNKEIKLVPKDGGSTVQFIGDKPTNYIVGEDGSLTFALATEKNDRFSLVGLEGFLNGGVSLDLTPYNIPNKTEGWLFGYNPQYSEPSDEQLNSYDLAQCGIGLYELNGIPYVLEGESYERRNWQYWLTNLSTTNKTLAQGSVFTKEENGVRTPLNYGKGVASKLYGVPQLDNGSLSFSPDNLSWKVLLGTSDIGSLSGVIWAFKPNDYDDGVSLTQNFGFKIIYTDGDGEQYPIDIKYTLERDTVESSWFEVWDYVAFEDFVINEINAVYSNLISNELGQGAKFYFRASDGWVDEPLSYTGPYNQGGGNGMDNSMPMPMPGEDGSMGDESMGDGSLPNVGSMEDDRSNIIYLGIYGVLDYEPSDPQDVFSESVKVNMEFLIDHENDNVGEGAFANVAISSFGGLIKGSDCKSWKVLSAQTTAPPPFPEPTEPEMPE